MILFLSSKSYTVTKSKISSQHKLGSLQNLKLNPNPTGGGHICPRDFQTLIPQEPKVGLTSNQAVNSSLSVVSRSKKKDWPNRTMKGPWRALSVQGSLHILHFLWHHPNENSYWLYFCILCNKNGIKGLWGDKG